MEKTAHFKIPESELAGKETPERAGVFTLRDFPEEFYDLTPLEATICSGTWGELALAVSVESEEAYMLVRDDLRNPGTRVRIYVPKTVENAESRFRKAVEDIVRGIPSWLWELPEEVKFPVTLAWLNVRETARVIRSSLLVNPITNPCFESIANDEKGVAAILDVTRNSVRTHVESAEYEKAFAKAMSMTDAMAADYAGQIEENSEEREAVIRVFAHVRKSEAEFFRHAYSKLRELFDDELGYLKFKDAPTDKPAEKTVVLWDIDESVVYNDGRIKKSYVRPAFFPLVELLKTVRPDVRHWVLTSRGDDRLRLQLSGHEPHYALTDLAGVFDSEYLFGKESYENANLGTRYGFYVSREETERVWYEDKVRGFHFVNQKEPATRFFLVDDLLQKHFENLGGGVQLCKIASATVMEALPLPEGG